MGEIVRDYIKVHYIGSVRRTKISEYVGQRIIRAWRAPSQSKWIYFATAAGRRGKFHQTTHEIEWFGSTKEEE